MNRWIPSFLLFICLFVWLDGFILPVFAQKSDKEPAENQTETEKPEKPKSAVEKYREFYDPKNYTENYKERYKDENYRKYYRDLHNQEYEGYRRARRILGPMNEAYYDMLDNSRHLDPQHSSIFNVDKYGRKIDPSANNNSGALFIEPSQLRHKSSYQPLPDNYGENGGVVYTNPGFWFPNPYEAIQNGLWQDNPLTKSAFSREGHKSNLPQTNTINLPEPMPSEETNSTGKPTGFNPFSTNPAMLPPHLIAPASPEIIQPTTSDAALPPLPQADSIQEKPSELPNAATASIKAPTDNLAKPAQQPPPRQVPIQQPYIPPQTLAPLSPAQTIYNQGVQSFAQRNYPKARQAFEKLATANPGSPYAHFGHGLSLFYAAEYSKSYNAFEQSEKLSAQRRQTPPNLWQMQTLPTDFRYHFKKLAQYVQQNPKEKTARDLLFYLSRISSKASSEAQK